MKVTKASSSTTPTRKGKARSFAPGGGDFTKALLPVSGHESPEPVENPGLLRTLAVDLVLSVQGVEDPLEGKRQGIAWGKEVLEQLETLQAGLLSGRFSPEQLDRMVDVLRRRKALTSHDSTLVALLKEIETRALVELAKMRRLGGKPL